MLMMLTLLNGCASHVQPIETEPPATAATVPAERPPAEESGPPSTEETNPVRESVEETEEASVTESTVPKVTEPKDPEPKPERNDTPANQPAEETEPPATTPPETEPPTKEPPTTEPPATEPEETLPPETVSEETDSPATEPPAEEPDQTEPPATEAPEETEPTEPEVTEYSYAFKREVASYAAQYLNQYRGSACTVLPGMSQVAQYRASQLTWNFAHSTADWSFVKVYTDGQASLHGTSPTPPQTNGRLWLPLNTASGLMRHWQDWTKVIATMKPIPVKQYVETSMVTVRKNWEKPLRI